MYTISKEFTFEASHQLHGLPVDHPCSRLHGHSYRVIVELSGLMLTGPGFIVDYNELRVFKAYLDTTFDHRHLNDLLLCEPTAENIAKHLFDWCFLRWPQTSAIGVSETAKSWAWWRPQ